MARKTSKQANITAQYYAALAPLLPDWVANTPGISVVMPRVSSASADKAAANVDAANRKLEHLPVMAQIKGIGGAEAIIANTPQAKKLRKSLGIVRVNRSNAHGGAQEPGRLMGWLLPSQKSKELAFLIASGAYDKNVDIAGDPIGSNVVTELLVEIMVHPNVTDLHVADWDRLTRNSLGGERIVEVARTFMVEIHAGSQEATDIHTAQGRMLAGIKSNIAEAERDSTATRSTRGALSLFNAPEASWPYAAYLIPPGYVATKVKQRDSDGKLHRRNVVRVATKFTTGWTEFFGAIAAGVSYAAAGQILAKHKIPVRGTRLNRKFSDCSQLAPAQLADAARAAAAHYELLRTRTYKREVVVPVATKGETWEGYPIERGGEHPNGVVQIEMALPDHGIKLTDAQWDAWGERISTTNRTNREPAADAPRHAFSSIALWQDDAYGYKFGYASDYYRVWRRPVTTAVDVDGNQRGWNNQEGEAILSVRAKDAERAFGEAIKASAVEALNQTTILHQVARIKPDDQAKIEALQQRLQELEIEIADAKEDFDDAAEALKTKEQTPNRQQRESEAKQILDGLTNERKRVTDLIKDSDIDIAFEQSTRDWEVSVELQTLAGLAGILCASDGAAMPRPLNDMLRGITNNSTRLVTTDNSRILRLTASLEWPTVDGEVLELPIDVPLRNATVAQRVAGDPGEDFCQAVLRDGYTYDEAGELTSLAGDGKNRYVYKWLAQHGISDRKRQRNILDCPINETKQVAWAILTDSPPPKGLDPAFVDLIKETYFGSPKQSVISARRHGFASWCGPVSKARTILNVFVAEAARGENIGQGLAGVGVAVRAGFSENASLPRLAEVEILDRDIKRSNALFPKQCPTCLAPLLHVVRTPEVTLICTKCCAVPGGAKLPNGYLGLWDRELNAGNDRTFLGDPGDYEPVTVIRSGKAVKQGRLRRMGEAAAYLGVRHTVLRNASDAGEIPVTREGKGGWRQFAQADLDAWMKTRLTERKGHRSTQPGQGMPDNHLTIEEGAKLLNIHPLALRKLAKSTQSNKGPVPYERVNLGRGVPTIVINKAALQTIDKTWVGGHSLDLMFIGEVAKKTGVSTFLIREATERELPCQTTDGGTRRYERKAVEKWIAGPGRIHTLLTTEAAAIRAGGISADTVRNAVSNGSLAVTTTPGGHRRYAPADIDAWVKMKLATGTPWAAASFRAASA